MSTEHEVDEPTEEGVLCPKCLLANSTAAAFCADCGAPIGMVSTVDPIQSIWAEGFAYRCAVEGPPKPIIVIGMWLIFGPTLLALPLSFFSSPSNDFATVFVALLEIAFGTILYRTTKNYIVKSRLAKERVAAEEIGNG